jgi:integrase
MSSIYARKNQLWYRVKVDGKWKSRRSKFVVGEEEQCRRFAAATQDALVASSGITGGSGPLLVKRYLEHWLEQRREAGHDWKQDRGRLTKHVIPVLGAHELAKLRAPLIADLVRRLRFKSDPRLAVRTVRNIYSVLAAALRDATINGLIDVSPCILTDAQLGSVVDKDPEWRAGALFTRDEAEILISHNGIPLDRRLVYGCGLLAGLRPGEVGALRWRHYNATDMPLGRLTVAAAYSSKRDLLKGTKTEAVRSVPVHPTLAAMLAEWRLSGWAAMMGRMPEPDDLIVPLPPVTHARRKRTGEPHRGDTYTYRRWIDIDLPMLGWRHRSPYATKSTFITLALDDGADADILEHRVTHTKRRRSAFDGYDRGERWAQACAEVAKLRIVRRSPDGNRVLAIVP